MCYTRPSFSLAESDVSSPALSQNLPADVLGRLSEIIHYMQSRQYQRANDSYLRLSIGNAAWPIGVTMVGSVHHPLLLVPDPFAVRLTDGAS